MYPGKERIFMEKKNNVLFSGVMPALVACVDDNGKVLEDSMRRLMAWHMREGMDGFYVCGATGEGPVLQPETRMRIAEIARDAAGDKAKIILHVGAIDLTTAVKLAKHAAGIGVDAISSVPPFFFGYGEKEIREYYTALSDASGLPILIYASPLSGVSITWDMVERFLNSVPNMIGLKWTSYDYFTMHRIKELNGGNVNVLNGPDECLMCGLAMGADGGIGGTYNIMPKLFRRIYDSMRAGDIEGARAAQFKANKVIEVLLKFGVAVGVKDALSMLGFDCGYTVYPQKRFTDEERAAFRAALKALDFEKEYV